MYDNYSMPDPRFYKLYANKFRDMHSLRTEDIDGAQPKKQTYDRNDFLNRYYDKVVSHNQVVQSNGPKNLNYWSLPQQDQNSSPVRQKGGMSYNGSTAQMTYSKPEDYHLPNNYKLPQKQNLPQHNQGQYQNLQHQEYTLQQYAGPQGRNSGNNSAIRNPMYSDFDYNNRQAPQYGNQNQYQSTPQRTVSKGGNNNIYVRDSLDALQMQYGGVSNNNSYQASPQYPQQNQAAEQNFKQDWLNFYGVDSAPQKQQNTVRQNQNQTPVKREDPTIRANAAKFYGEGPSEEDQYQKNLHAFYGADNSLPVRNAKGNLAKAHSNALNKGAKLYNPLIHAPMLHYAKDPSKFEQPKVKDVREQWQFKQNLQKFYDV